MTSIARKLFLSGMVLVSAMAIQNAFHRLPPRERPPSTIMTGTTTQVMIDVADRIYAPNAVESQSGARTHTDVDKHTDICHRLRHGGSLVQPHRRECFVVPPIVGSLQLIARVISKPEWLT